MVFRLSWPTEYDNITQRFGENPSTYQKFGLPGHEGIDFVAPHGSEIYAAADGVVSDVRLDGFADPMAKPYGNQVRIQHAEGFETIYAHLASAVVTPGQVVKARQLIALADNTGNSSGSHLHFSLKKAGATSSGETTYPYDLVDPAPYLDPFTDEDAREPEIPDEPSIRVQVVSPSAGFLNVRAAPYLGSQIVTKVDHGALLDVLEEEATARAKVGQQGQWLWVRTPGDVVGHVAAWYVKLPEPPPSEMEPMIVLVDSPDDPLRLRAGPSTAHAELGRLVHGTELLGLEGEAEVMRKVGQPGAWLHVQTPLGVKGYVAAWYTTLPEAVPEPPEEPVTVIFLVVDSPDQPLRLRAGPSTSFDEIGSMVHGTTLKALEDPEVVKEKVAQFGAWLYVQTPQGQKGYAAAWYLELKPSGEQPVIPDPGTGAPTAYVVVESPELGLRLRAGPGTEYDHVWWVPHKTALTSLEDEATTGRKIGQVGQWIHVRTPARYEGYVAAWYVRHPTQADDRQPATSVETGLSPHIFGIHAVSVADDITTVRDRIRGLYQGKGKRGWIFFTEIVGRHAQSIQFNAEIRRRLWDWADQGYGVIIRLNHGYEPGGTLPESRFYDEFAAAAARWVELYLKDANRAASSYAWTLQIANEQNNPREHPGGFEHPTEHITAERYADAFNKTYARIKAVLPNTIVCPGAVDPYNYMPMNKLGGERWRPLDYFTTMLENITALDGIILHAYTHGPDPAYITHLKRFGDGTGPLWDHYYDFQIYRLFMERVPSKWRDLPAYITETDHIHRPAGEHDQGWVNQNVGWVRAAYAEIDRWNRTPYAQQIRCLLLYRWMMDAWSINDKPEVLNDFKQALNHDYRWRTTPTGGAFAFTAAPPAAIRPQVLEERRLVQPDDLTRIWGLGEKAQMVLNAAGVMIYEQLARLTPEELDVLIGETGLRARYEETWPEQARLAVDGDWEALEAYRERLD